VNKRTYFIFMHIDVHYIWMWKQLWLDYVTIKLVLVKINKQSWLSFWPKSSSPTPYGGNHMDPCLFNKYLWHLIDKPISSNFCTKAGEMLFFLKAAVTRKCNLPFVIFKKPLNFRTQIVFHQKKSKNHKSSQLYYNTESYFDSKTSTRASDKAGTCVTLRLNGNRP